MTTCVRAALAAVLLAGAFAACGGASKPPMQPDNDSTALADAGTEPAPAASQTPAAPAPK